MQTEIKEQLHQFQQQFEQVRDQLQLMMVGMADVIEQTLTCLFAGGHILLEGLPGLGKTMLVKSLAATCQLNFSRIQFTPDLMPADIIGTDVVLEDPQHGRTFQFRPGPIHSQLILADEINRATPKTQSAMLEAMQEAQVTAGNKTYTMQQPFLVLATQNPIEMEGTYPLPEAQVDRFLFKTLVKLGSVDELCEILRRTTGASQPQLKPVTDGPAILQAREFLQNLAIPDNILNYTARLILNSHPDSPTAPDSVKRYLRYGSSPRGAQALIRAAQIYAALDDRLQLDFSDIQKAALPALRHRLILNFEGEAENIDPDTLVQDIIKATPTQI